MLFSKALEGILSLLLVVVVGFFLAKKKKIPANALQSIPGLITNISLPALLLNTILRNFHSDDLLGSLYCSLAPLCVMALVFTIAWFFGKIFSVQRSHLGLFCACSSNPNTIYIGVPVSVALFGPDTVHYVLLFYLASTTFFWTVGNYAISRDAGKNTRVINRHSLAKFFSPPMITLFFSMSLVMLDIRLPSFFMEGTKTLGYITTPLALIFIGAKLAELEWRQLRVTRDIAMALTGRMVLSPFLMWLILPYFDLPPVMGKIFVIQASLPVLMQAAILSAYYGADSEYGSIMVSLSTILAAITVPVCMALVG